LAGMNGMFLYAVLVITPKIPGFEPSLFSGSETVF
jgi:hypothetical protein